MAENEVSKVVLIWIGLLLLAKQSENLTLLTLAYRWVNLMWVKDLMKNTSYETGKCKPLLKNQQANKQTKKTPKKPNQNQTTMTTSHHTHTKKQNKNNKNQGTNQPPQQQQPNQTNRNTIMFHLHTLNSRVKAGTDSHLLQTCRLWITAEQIWVQMFIIHNIC